MDEEIAVNIIIGMYTMISVPVPIWGVVLGCN
jgi:hypothetical protein